MGYQYETTVSVVIFEDTDPSGSIEFKMETTPITNMKSTVEIPFTVLPTMAAVTASEFQGLNVKITQDLNTGQGVVALTPTAYPGCEGNQCKCFCRRRRYGGISL